MLRTIFIVSILALLVAPASANLFLDEDFEDGTPFTNNDYPVRNENTTPPSLTPTGTNLRCWEDSAGYAGPPQYALTNSGTVVSTAAYSGSSCLELTSGQSVAIDDSGGLYVGNGQNNHVVMQFALSFPASVFSLPADTQVGHYAQDWDTDNLGTSAIELTYQLNFVTNSTNGVNIVVNNNSTVAFTLNAPDEWAVITVIAAKASDATWGGGYTWIAWDPFTQTFKGPQPAAGNTATGEVVDTDMAVLLCGIHLYINSNTDTDFIANTDLGATPTWCELDTNKGNTHLISWQLVAENGGTLLVDDMYHSVGELQNILTPPGPSGQNYYTQEDAARLLDFVGPGAPQVTGAKTWTLFE